MTTKEWRRYWEAPAGEWSRVMVCAEKQTHQGAVEVVESLPCVALGARKCHDRGVERVHMAWDGMVMLQVEGHMHTGL